MSMPAVGSSLWIKGEVRRYLTRGDYDSFFAGWPGRTVIDIATDATQRLRAALVEVTLRRARGFERSVPLPEPIDPWLRNKLSPMVKGLFTVHEHNCMLDALAGGDHLPHTAQYRRRAYHGAVAVERVAPGESVSG